MKTFKILICTFLIFSQLHAQTEKPVFRKGYTRLGISTLGKTLNNNLSPKENIFNGNYGAGIGLVAEKGTIFYFKLKATKGKINYGLDWTVFSATFNKLDKWNSYANAAEKTYTNNGKDFSVSAATKLGPVISFNPVEKLVIDARFQVAAIARVTPFEYYEDENDATARSFAFFTIDDANDDGSATLKSMLSTGIGSNIGLTVRRGGLGLSFDYISVKSKTNYDSYESNDIHTFGTQKIPTHSMQLKLSITL